MWKHSKLFEKSLIKIIFKKKLIKKEKLQNMNRKGQAEMGETLLVLLVIIILIIAGIFVYYGFFARGLGSLGQERTDIENLILLHIFASLPETKCENEDCIDIVKVFAFKDLIKENKAYYLRKFKDKKILIEFIYPESTNKNIECTRFQTDVPNNCGYIIVYDNIKTKPEYSVSLPVSLYFSNINEYKIGLLKIQGEE